MAASPSKKQISNYLRKMANKYVGVEFRVLRASNGEVAILPVNPATGEPEATNPQVFVVANAKAAVKAAWEKMCAHDKIDPQNTFVVFSTDNPYQAEYNRLMGVYLDAAKVLEGRK